MLTTIAVSFVVLFLSCIALAIGQFFGRKPVMPKCNPDSCCMQGERCSRPSAASAARR